MAARPRAAGSSVFAPTDLFALINPKMHAVPNVALAHKGPSTRGQRDSPLDYRSPFNRSFYAHKARPDSEIRSSIHVDGHCPRTVRQRQCSTRATRPIEISRRIQRLEGADRSSYHLFSPPFLLPLCESFVAAERDTIHELEPGKRRGRKIGGGEEDGGSWRKGGEDDS